MKQLLFTGLLSLGLALTTQAQDTQDFGESFKAKKIATVPEFRAAVDDSAPAEWKGNVTGTVKEVCKKEGCWLRLDDGSATGILVKMKDHAFTLPKDIDGRKVIVYGTAVKKTTTVDQLRHFAEDAGKSKEEIAAITEPKVEIVMQAHGVKLLQ